MYGLAAYVAVAWHYWRAWLWERPTRLAALLLAGPPPEHLALVVRWVEGHTRPVAVLADADVLGTALDVLARKLDGKPAAGNTYNRKRAVLHNALEYAVDKGCLDSNPLTGPTTSTARMKPKTAYAVSPRVVVNRKQAEALLEAVRSQTRMGPHLVAFFGCLYYAALRPSEAADIRRENLDIPEESWGTLLLGNFAPGVGSSWTDTGTRHERRQLKHRAPGEERPVPCPPPLTRLLRAHIEVYGTDAEGRLFRGERGGEVSDSVYQRIWARARTAALTSVEAASPLARHPYDLRHAAVSTWLNAGVPATQVAQWAGHSVAVLLRVYAKCIAGQDEDARQRIDQALREEDERGEK